VGQVDRIDDAVDEHVGLGAARAFAGRQIDQRRAAQAHQQEDGGAEVEPRLEIGNPLVHAVR